jgi:hypothetical protein
MRFECVCELKKTWFCIVLVEKKIRATPPNCFKREWSERNRRKVKKEWIAYKNWDMELCPSMLNLLNIFFRIKTYSKKKYIHVSLKSFKWRKLCLLNKKLVVRKNDEIWITLVQFNNTMIIALYHMIKKYLYFFFSGRNIYIKK